LLPPQGSSIFYLEDTEALNFCPLVLSMPDDGKTLLNFITYLLYS
jgi:hypothetical protein